MVSVLQMQTDLETRGLASMLKYADEQLLAFFPSADSTQLRDGASWPLPGAGREFLPSVGRVPWSRSRELSSASASSAQGSDAARGRSGQRSRDSPSAPSARRGRSGLAKASASRRRKSRRASPSESHSSRGSELGKFDMEGRLQAH